ncbi:MAG: hypothetical protein QOJ99_2463 [Bryobacterales bacterium]|jgi:hypothetical protein|nr:hypothetical protein [Bryobacterales bacterium]
MSSAAHISEAQLNANRQNAGLSTGPRTEEAKKRTRLNGLRHGLTGQTVVMPHEDLDAYEQFCSLTIAGLQPANEAERALAEVITDDKWRLNRARAIEENIFSLQLSATSFSGNVDDEVDQALNQAQTFLDHAREIQLLTLYAGRIARAIDKNKAELKVLQTARIQARQAALEEALLLAELAQSKGETCVSADPDPENGFGFSTSELHLLIDRRKRLAEARALFATHKDPKTSSRKAA